MQLRFTIHTWKYPTKHRISSKIAKMLETPLYEAYFVSDTARSFARRDPEISYRLPSSSLCLLLPHSSSDLCASFFVAHCSHYYHLHRSLLLLLHRVFLPFRRLLAPPRLRFQLILYFVFVLFTLVFLFFYHVLFSFAYAGLESLRLLHPPLYLSFEY